MHPALDRLDPDARAAAGRRLWALADPYYLVRGNDRWTEHMSRHTSEPHSATRTESPRASLDGRPGRARRSLRARDQLDPLRPHRRNEHDVHG